MKFGKTMTMYTDYPFAFLGDFSGKPSPVRKVKVVAYDGNKYLTVIVDGVLTEVKRGYVYYRRERHQSMILNKKTGFKVISNCITRRDLKLLPKPPVQDSYYGKIKAIM